MQNTKKEINQRYIDNLEKHIEKTENIIDYSIKRFDLLIISISSGALVFSINFIDNILNKTPDVNLVLVKISWLMFGLSIIINLLSQLTSYYTNKFEIIISKNIIRKQRGKEFKGDQDKFKERNELLNNFTVWFNYLSISLLILGIFLLVIFMYKFF